MRVVNTALPSSFHPSRCNLWPFLVHRNAEALGFVDFGDHGRGPQSFSEL